jgi:hypothetical protein
MLNAIPAGMSSAASAVEQTFVGTANWLLRAGLSAALGRRLPPDAAVPSVGVAWQSKTRPPDGLSRQTETIFPMRLGTASACGYRNRQIDHRPGNMVRNHPPDGLEQQNAM